MTASGAGQRQDSLYDQMVTVLTLANAAGCYDAYDWIADAFAMKCHNDDQRALATCWICGDEHTEERHRLLVLNGVKGWREAPSANSDSGSSS